MANLYKQKRLTIVTLIYWFLLAYILAALVWWFIALWQQTEQMTAYKLQELNPGDPDKLAKEMQIKRERNRKEIQYIGEGATFMLLILVGAVFVYRAVRKEIRLTTQQQNFMMAVTHELKTPIAVGKLNLETLRKRKLDETQQDKLIGNTLQEMNRLNDLCNNILLVSQMESGAYRMAKESCDLSELVLNTVTDFRTRFPMRELQAAILDNVRLYGDPLLLQLAINNLVENALKYSTREKPVSVKLEEGTSGITLEIKDQGPGIPEQERKKVFEKFYRVGAEITRQTKGTGLGLFLTQKIVKDHGGNVSVFANFPTGSIFVINFPVKRT